MRQRSLACGLAMAIATTTTFSALTLPTSATADEVQYFPVASSRVGPYSAMGTGYYGAQIDYMNYVNMNGGVNGVMLTWQECETEYNAVKTVECYQRLLEKDGQRIVVYDQDPEIRTRHVPERRTRCCLGHSV
ncbi:MAG: ABC transporter substrate-binding protein, partial [Neomegalonema sp.]